MEYITRLPEASRPGLRRQADMAQRRWTGPCRRTQMRRQAAAWTRPVVRQAARLRRRRCRRRTRSGVVAPCATRPGSNRQPGLHLSFRQRSAATSAAERRDLPLCGNTTPTQLRVPGKINTRTTRTKRHCLAPGGTLASMALLAHGSHHAGERADGARGGALDTLPTGLLIPGISPRASSAVYCCASAWPCPLRAAGVRRYPARMRGRPSCG
jgi:hypothetical protein